MYTMTLLWLDICFIYQTFKPDRSLALKHDCPAVGPPQMTNRELPTSDREAEAQWDAVWLAVECTWHDTAVIFIFQIFAWLDPGRQRVLYATVAAQPKQAC